jgi:hypothetical protein
MVGRMMRKRPPNRRGAIAFTVTHEGLECRAHLGHFDDGSLAELFLDAKKPDSALDALAADAAILISLLLQRGSSAAEIGHALRRTPSGRPASLIGAVVDALAQQDTATPNTVGG